MQHSTTYERMEGYVFTNSFKFKRPTWKVQKDNESDDFDALAEQDLKDYNCMHLDGIAGAGKTTLVRKIVKQLKKQGKAVQILCPTNKACRNYDKEDVMTIHKFLASSFHDVKGLKKKISHLDVLIIDEISMCRELFYKVFQTMKKLKPELRIIMAGDFRQLEPINDRVICDYKNSLILMELCDGNRLELSKCRRSDKELYEASLNVNKINIKNIGGKYRGKKNCMRSISFTNKKRKEINDKWMKKLFKKEEGVFVKLWIMIQRVKTCI